MDRPAATSSFFSEPLELETAGFAFFVTGGLAGGGGESDATVFLVGLRASLGKSELDVEWSTFFPSAGTDERVFEASTGGVSFFDICCPSSELPVAESSSDFAFDELVPSASHDRCRDLVGADSSQ